MDDPQEIAVAIGIALARAEEWKQAIIRHSDGLAMARLRQITVEELRLKAIRAVVLNQLTPAPSVDPLPRPPHPPLWPDTQRVGRSRTPIEKTRVSVTTTREICRSTRAALDRARKLLARSKRTPHP